MENSRAKETVESFLDIVCAEFKWYVQRRLQLSLEEALHDYQETTAFTYADCADEAARRMCRIFEASVKSTMGLVL